MGLTSREQIAELPHLLKVSSEISYDAVLDICKKEYIDDLAQATVMIGLFRNVGDSIAEAKALAKMVICAGIEIDVFKKNAEYKSIPPN